MTPILTRQDYRSLFAGRLYWAVLIALRCLVCRFVVVRSKPAPARSRFGITLDRESVVNEGTSGHWLHEDQECVGGRERRDDSAHDRHRKPGLDGVPLYVGAHQRFGGG